jgi:ligand-binding sensor domain-containing protein/signal transduction histidine kinase
MTAAGRIIFIVVCVLYSVSASGQRYPFHNLSVDQGLMQSQATCLAQDKTGNLWVGTLGGLGRYDGRNFTNYSVRNGLLSNIVSAVAVDSQENVWIGSPAGISRFNGRAFTHYKMQQPKTRTVYTTQQIMIIKDTVWWRAQGEVYFIADGKIKYFSTPGANGRATALMVEKNGLWVAKDGTIFHNSNNKWDSIKFNTEAEKRPPNVYRIFRGRDSIIWVTTNDGLYKADSGRLVQQQLNGPPDMPVPVIFSITQDRSGALWMGTSSGVIKKTGNLVQYYNKHNGLSDNYFYDVLTDAEGNVWMASDGQGIFRFSGTQFTGIDETMGLPSAQVMSIASNKRDSLFLGTYDAGLYVFKDGKVNPLSFPSNPVPSITSLCYTHRSKLWIGTRGRGLWSYENETFRQYEAPARNFPSNFITSLYEDHDRRLWIGFSNGAIVVEHDTFKTVPVKIGLIVSFLTIGYDSILIATDNGLQLYRGGYVTDFWTNQFIAGSSVKCFILVGRDLWMGTSDNGVIRYNLDTRKMLTINKNSGLRSDFIYNIVADNDGNIWVGTGFGIHKIKMNQKDEPQISFYGKAQGISGMESNLNSVLKLPDGSIWFGTTNGALHYQPHTEVVVSSPISIALQSVKPIGGNVIDRNYYDSSDNWYGIPYHLRLPPGQNNLSFTFQAVTLSGAQQVLYRYRLDGLETPWSDWSANNSATYSALPPGDYTFRVQARSAEGIAAPELTYPFVIITPFHKTKWFLYAVLAGCLLSGILFQYLVSSARERRLRLRSRLRSEEQAKIRLRTAEDFHDEIGNKLTRINVLTNVLKNKITQTPDTTRILGQIEDNTAQLYSGTRDILWSLKPSNDSLHEILHRIRDFATELFEDTNVNFTFIGSDERWHKLKLPMDMSRNLIMIFKEALNNALKYSNAQNISITVTLRNRNVLQIIMKDDGQGFDQLSVIKGNGLNNMQVRAGRLNGRLYIDSRKDKGTILNLTFKIPLNR